MFTMVSTGGTEFVEDEDFLLRRSFLVTEKDGFDVFLFRSWTDKRSSFGGKVSGNIYYESTIPFYSDLR
jgi:hypothetical protein